MDLDAYRRTADRFITELMREYYRHYAGLKDSFEIEAIYAAHEGLSTRDAVQALRELDARITEDGDERRRGRMLLDFAVEGYVGAATKAGRARMVELRDEGFCCACYLRAWALETHLRSYLRERFGPAWFESREAGDVLRRLWRDGQRLDAEELLGELTGARPHFGAVLADLGLSSS
jgi:hypothetical protein